MKILIYINILSGGGAERVVSNLSNYLQNNNEVVLVNTFKTENEYYISKSVKRYYLEQKGESESNIIFRNILRIKKLRNIIKFEKPNLVISFMCEPNVRTIIASLGLMCKTIISVRNSAKNEYPGKIGYLISRLILPLADGCVYQTNEAKEWFPKLLQEKSKIIVNPVREDFFSLVRKPIYGRIVTLGRLAKQKNHELLIKSFCNIKDIIPNSVLEIYGIGDEYQNLLNLINDLKISERVLLKGRTHHPEKILEKADIFVLSSDFEGLPNSLMEAMAVGVPCISTDCVGGGARFLIKDKVNGLLVPMKDEIKMSEALLTLLKNEELKDKIGIEARKSAETFKPEKIYKQWNDYINDIINLDFL